MKFWTDDRVSILRASWGKKFTEDIAAEIGCTRSAVIGKAHRLGLPKLDRIQIARTPESRAKVSRGLRKRWAAASLSKRREQGRMLQRGLREYWQKQSVT